MAVDDGYTKALIHFDANPITEESGKTVTNTGVTVQYAAYDVGTAVIPTMTADNAPSPFVVAVNFTLYSPSYPAWNAFDGSSGTLCHSAAGTYSGIYTMTLDTGYAVNAYYLEPQAGYPARAPKDWTFEGSNNGIDWTVLDTVTNGAGNGKYHFTNTTSYNYYRLNVTALNGDQYFVMQTIQLYTGANPVSSNFNKVAKFGTNSYLSMPDSDDWYMGTGDFTFDFRLNLASIGANQTVFSQYAADNDWYGLVWLGSNTWRFVIDNEVNIDFAGSGVLAGTMYHWEFSRHGNEWKMFKDGTQFGSTVTNSRVIDQITGAMLLGCLKLGTYYLAPDTLLDEFRASKGIARHTTDFTPLTTPYIGISGIFLATFI